MVIVGKFVGKSFCVRAIAWDGTFYTHTDQMDDQQRSFIMMDAYKSLESGIYGPVWTWSKYFADTSWLNAAEPWNQ